jgi:hypothetical protein
MDPNLFHIDWERTFEVLGAIVVLSFIVERALAPLFEHRAFIRRFERRGVKEPVAFLVALAVCIYWEFDAMSMIVLRERVSLAGEVLTAAVIAGGSKGAVKLFREVLGFKSRAYAEYERERQAAEKVPA